jgi:poly-gamma-glutamate synthase PgsB/CapB
LRYLFIFGISLFVYWMLEYLLHLRRLKRVPTRIHVNGARGKTTTTRLIASGLREAGLKVIAKTTGTVPRLILEDGEEIPIKRRGGANIKEQIKAVSESSKRGVDAVVIECMALDPEIQWASEHRIVKSTIGVITNVRQDHAERIGPLVEDMARALKMSIPVKGKLVTSESEFVPFFRQEADKLQTELVFADPSRVEDSIMTKFPYLSFKENVAIALEVCKVLGVDEEAALRGMIKAKPDPGILRFFRISSKGKTLYFVNLFAANDLESTRVIWDRLIGMRTLSTLPSVGVLNIRADRVWRCIQFSRALASDFYLYKIILVGDLIRLIRRAIYHLEKNRERIICKGRWQGAEDLLDTVLRFPHREMVIYGFGNTLGMGLELIRFFEERGQEVWL